MGKAKTIAGSTLLLIGLIVFTSFLVSMRTHTLLTWDETFFLNPSEQNRPFRMSAVCRNWQSYDKQPTLDGEIMVDGGTVELTVQDSKDSREIISTTIDHTYAFSIPANEGYEFIIQNVGSQKASVNLEFETMALYIVRPLMDGLVVLLVTALSGTLLIVSGRKSRKSTFEMRH